MSEEHLNNKMANNLMQALNEADAWRSRYYKALKEIAEMSPIAGETEMDRRQQSMRRCFVMQSIAKRALNEE